MLVVEGVTRRDACKTGAGAVVAPLDAVTAPDMAPTASVDDWIARAIEFTTRAQAVGSEEHSLFTAIADAVDQRSPDALKVATDALARLEVLEAGDCNPRMIPNREAQTFDRDPKSYNLSLNAARGVVEVMSAGGTFVDAELAISTAKVKKHRSVNGGNPLCRRQVTNLLKFPSFSVVVAPSFGDRPDRFIINNYRLPVELRDGGPGVTSQSMQRMCDLRHQLGLIAAETNLERGSTNPLMNVEWRGPSFIEIYGFRVTHPPDWLAELYRERVQQDTFVRLLGLDAIHSRESRWLREVAAASHG